MITYSDSDDSPPPYRGNGGVSLRPRRNSSGVRDLWDLLLYFGYRIFASNNKLGDSGLTSYSASSFIAYTNYSCCWSISSSLARNFMSLFMMSNIGFWRSLSKLSCYIVPICTGPLIAYLCRNLRCWSNAYMSLVLWSKSISSSFSYSFCMKVLWLRISF